MDRAAYIHDYGGTGQTIVLLHGFLGSSKYWSRLAPKLVDAGHKVLALDLMGFGKSDKPQDAKYDYDDHVGFIKAALSKHGVNTPVILIGHSMGAIVAKRFALLHERQVDQLVLLHPPLYQNADEAKFTLRDTGKLYRFLLDSRFRDVAWSVCYRIKILRIANHTKRSRELSLQNIIEKAEALSDVMKLRSKTLLVVGRKDRPQYAQNVSRLQLPASVHLVHENISHHSPVMNPKMISQLILSFTRNARLPK